MLQVAAAVPMPCLAIGPVVGRTYLYDDTRQQQARGLPPPHPYIFDESNLQRDKRSYKSNPE